MLGEGCKCSRGRAMALWNGLVLAAALAGCVVADSRYSVNSNENLPGQTCFAQPVGFSSKYFYYSASIGNQMQLAPGCSANDIFVSRLYMSGTCVQSRDNTESSSCSGQTSVVVVSSGSGFAVPANNTSAVCNQVFGGSAPSGAFMSLSAAAGGAFDSATLCAETNAGYFFLLNNCTGSARSLVPLNVNVQAYSGSCNGRSSWFGGGLSGWAIAVIIVSLGALVLAFGGCWWRRRRFGMGGSPAAVSMSQVNAPPPPSAGTYGQHAPPYSPSGYEHYPPYTPSGGVYPDGRPVNPPPPDESGVAMGYPKV